jgi:EAL domain-containing protein (putative c-di-GMP-specific phosphodiesterase class I)
MLDLLKYCDIAMYAAKNKGRNAVQFFTSAMNQAAQSRMALEHDLRQAIDQRAFSLVYQPKIEALSGRVIGAEALIRWSNGPQGNVPPSVFIPLVEDMGLIGTLGAWVLEEACRQLALWNQRAGPILNMAINLSAQQLHDENLADFVASLLQQYGLSARQIELEVTESTAMTDPQRAIEQLVRLRNVGVTLAIDDFGTGYSSLAYLKDLPIQTLKIDRSFVQNIETNQRDAAISRATLALAHSLQLKVVAEGIETPGQAEFLREHGCDLMQGYYFGRPEAAENWPAQWLNGQSNLTVNGD